MFSGQQYFATLPLTLSLVSSFCAWSQTFVLSFLPIPLAVDTVASDYALPAIGARSGLSPIRLCPCRANWKEGLPFLASPLFSYMQVYPAFSMTAKEASGSDSKVTLPTVRGGCSIPSRRPPRPSCGRRREARSAASVPCA